MIKPTLMAVATAIMISTTATAAEVPFGLVPVGPSVVQDLRYTTANNVTGRPLAGYAGMTCHLSPVAAEALAKATQALPDGYQLKVFDCYRPQAAVDDLVAWAEAGHREFIDQGYIARRSGHTAGNAVDLTVVDAAGRELDMGTAFDDFSRRAWADSPQIGAVAANRRIMATAMISAGFRGYAREWWHWSYSK